MTPDPRDPRDPGDPGNEFLTYHFAADVYQKIDIWPPLEGHFPRISKNGAFGSHWHHFGQHWHNFGSHWHHFGSHWYHFGSHLWTLWVPMTSFGAPLARLWIPLAPIYGVLSKTQKIEKMKIEIGASGWCGSIRLVDRVCLILRICQTN